MKQLDRFLASLPGGIDAYPDHRQKASIYLHYAETTSGLERLRPVLPAPVQALLDSPELPNAWVPEVHSTSLFLAIIDSREMSEDDLYRDWLVFNRSLFRSRLYKMLLRAASPELIIRGAGYRWGAFHRGIELKVGGESKKKMWIEMHYPAELVPRIIAVGYGAAFRAAAEQAGPHEARVQLVEHTPTVARWDASWS